MRGRSAADQHGNSSWVKMEPQDVLSEVLKVYPLLKLKVFVDDMQLHVWCKKQAQTCCSKSKIEVIIDRWCERR